MQRDFGVVWCQRIMLALGLLQTVPPFKTLITGEKWRRHRTKVERRLAQEKAGKQFKSHKEKVG